ncbi:hypothetical protein [Alkaliphilus transvaalensis]|uniref:hypothetical protein n=1 Tax=Alkaliphilus transvaalensis TaxID=114628 RepID=UPI00047DC7DE|nr:hypothetical protein [Alkaliphilus transvaalensis]
MIKIEEIKVMGYKQELHNQFIRNKETALAILIPGIAYSNDMPLLYYVSELLIDKGYDILKINPHWKEIDSFLTADSEEKRKWISTDVVNSVEEILNKKKYSDIFLVTKSIGMLGALEVLNKKVLFRNAKVLWLTPLCHVDNLVRELIDIANQSLIMIGTADRCYSIENIKALKKRRNYRVKTFSGTDHSLEIMGDVKGSLKVLEKVLEEVEHFI